AVEVVETADHLQVLEAGQVLIHRGILAGQSHTLPGPPRLAEHVDAGDPGAALVGHEQGGEDADKGRLAGAVRPQQAEHDPGRHVDAVPAPALLLGAIVSFQVGAAGATHMFGPATVEGSVFLRSALGAAILVLIARPTLRGRSRADLGLLVLLGALLAAMNSAFYQAVDR